MVSGCLETLLHCLVIQVLDEEGSLRQDLRPANDDYSATDEEKEGWPGDCLPYLSEDFVAVNEAEGAQSNCAKAKTRTFKKEHLTKPIRVVLLAEHCQATQQGRKYQKRTLARQASGIQESTRL